MAGFGGAGEGDAAVMGGGEGGATREESGKEGGVGVLGAPGDGEVGGERGGVRVVGGEEMAWLIRGWGGERGSLQGG